MTESVTGVTLLATELDKSGTSRVSVSEYNIQTELAALKVVPKTQVSLVQFHLDSA